MVHQPKHFAALIGAGLAVTLAGALSGCSGSSEPSNNAAATSSKSPSGASSSAPSSSPSSSSSNGGGSLTTQCDKLSSELEDATSSLASSMESFSSALGSNDPATLDKAQATVDQLANVFDTAAAKVTDAQLKPAVDKLSADFGQLASLTSAIVTAQKTSDLTAMTQSATQIQSLESSMQSDATAVSKLCGF